MQLVEMKPYVRYARYLNLAADAGFTPHIAYDTRLFYVYEGSGFMEAGGMEYQMREGSVLIIHSGVEYYLKPPEKLIRYLAVNFDYTFGHSQNKIPIGPQKRNLFVPEKTVEDVRFEDAAYFNEVLYLNNMQQIAHKLVALEHEYTHRQKFSELRAGNLLSEVLIECAREAESLGSASAQQTAEQIVSYLHENFVATITNQDVAELFGFHPNYISSLIKEYTGMPMHRYLTHLRLLHAAKLLDEGTLSVTEVAEACGFRDIYYFSKYFKKMMGISPTDYRKN
jgi:AraC-like DNA-binding protein